AEIHTALRDVYIKLGRLRDASKVQERIDRKVSSPRRPAPETPDALPRMPVRPAAPPNGQPPASVAIPPAGRAPAAPAPPKAPPPRVQPPRVQPPRVQPPVQPVRPEPPQTEPSEAEAAEAEFPQHEPPRAQPPAAPPAPARPQPPRERQIPRPAGRPQLVPPPREEPARGKPRPRSESLGQILLDGKMVSREQLDRAIQMQHRRGFDDVRQGTGVEIEPVVAAEQDIMTAIGKHYAGDVNLEEAMRQAVTQDVEIPEEKGEEFSLEKLRTLTEEAPVVRLVNVIISQSISDGASDIHIEPHRRSVQVRYRVDGLLHDVMTPPKAMQAAIVSRIKIMANLDIADRRLPPDGTIHEPIEHNEFHSHVPTL